MEKERKTMPNHNRTDVFHENDDNFDDSFLLCAGGVVKG